MKKAYLKPFLEVIEIDAEILAGNQSYVPV